MESDSNSKVIGGSKAYNRMRAGEITPEEAAAEMKQEAAAGVEQDIARQREQALEGLVIPREVVKSALLKLVRGEHKLKP
jgi:hypothetical protein